MTNCKNDDIHSAELRNKLSKSKAVSRNEESDVINAILLTLIFINFRRFCKMPSRDMQ